MIHLAAILLAIAGYFNGLMDHLMFHMSEYNPSNTWKAKYKKDAEGNLIPSKKKPLVLLGFVFPEIRRGFPVFKYNTGKYYRSLAQIQDAVLCITQNGFNTSFCNIHKLQYNNLHRYMGRTLGDSSPWVPYPVHLD